MFPLLKKPLGTQYLEVLRILVPSETLIPLERSAQFNAYVTLNNFPHAIHKKDFDIYDQLIMSIFSKKLAQNKYIYM